MEEGQLRYGRSAGTDRSAHEGIGLGHEFLRHVERTRVIIHVVDMSGSEGRDPFDDWLKINEELVLYNAKLASVLRSLPPTRWTCRNRQRT